MKISIITVCKNPGESIKRTVESVLAQTYQNIEYIVVDGDSKDSTAQYLEEIDGMICKGERFFAPTKCFQFISELDSGIYNAMNKGIDLANGEYLLFLNAGDYLVDGDVISKVVENIEKDESKSDIYFGDIISEDPVTMERYAVPNRLKIVNSIKLFFWTVPHAAAFIKKDALTRVGGYDESFRISADYDFFVKAFVDQKMKFNHIPLNSSVFQTDGISSDRRNSKLMKNENLKIIKKYYGAFPSFLYNIAPVLVVLRFIYKVWIKLEKDR